MKAADFSRLTVDELLNVRDIINDILSTKIDEERRNLQLRMDTLNRFNQMHHDFGKDTRRLNKIPPKYQNPENPLETWAGRGKTPKWMAAALKKGKKQEDFLIERPVKAGRR